MEEILESKSIYRIEYELIQNIKVFRSKRGWSQNVLSDKMRFSRTFVGKCESLDQDAKYNVRHLGILKPIFGFKSLDDFFPNGLPKDELIKIRYRKVPRKKADGSPSKLFDTEVVEIVVVEEETKVKGNKN